MSMSDNARYSPVESRAVNLTLNNCTGTACMEINKKLACTLLKSKNRVATRFCTSVMLYKR